MSGNISQTELITPLLAEKWLATVPEYQRKIKSRQVQKLVIAIQKGEWRANGATIVFNAKGELIDGQHRLTAIVQSGKSVQSIVVRGVSADVQTFHTLGDVLPRSLTDFIHAKHATIVSSVLRMIWAQKNGVWPIGHGQSSNRQVVPPIPDILKTGKECIPLIEDLCVDPLTAAGRMVQQQSFCIFLVYYYTHVSPVKDLVRLVEFFARVADGLNLTLNDPVYRLRQKFLQLGPGMSIDRTARQALVLKALHLYLDGKDCPKLQYVPEREQFPALRTK